MSKAEGKERTAEAFRDAETANLRAWMKLSGGQKIDFFEEMVELAYRRGGVAAGEVGAKRSEAR